MISVKSDDELIEQLVERDPNHPGPADVRVKDYYIHVWALVGDLMNHGFQLEPVAAEYDIPADYVRAALAYYRRHPQIIDGRLEANSADENTPIDSKDPLVLRLIERDPYSPGPDDVRLRDYGIHVWAIAGDLENDDFDVERVARSHDIPVDYVRAALAYYREHKEVIDGRLAANNND